MPIGNIPADPAVSVYDQGTEYKHSFGSKTPKMPALCAAILACSRTIAKPRLRSAGSPAQPRMQPHGRGGLAFVYLSSSLTDRTRYGTIAPSSADDRLQYPSGHQGGYSAPLRL